MVIQIFYLVFPIISMRELKCWSKVFRNAPMHEIVIPRVDVFRSIFCKCFRFHCPIWVLLTHSGPRVVLMLPTNSSLRPRQAFRLYSNHWSKKDRMKNPDSILKTCFIDEKSANFALALSMGILAALVKRQIARAIIKSSIIASKSKIASQT